MTREIGVDLLVAHPENCNHMEAETREKIKRHILRTGNYEPLTVRPHPGGLGKFQVINGHHRLLVLKELGHATANCSIWDIDDDQTRLYLATLNRLTGKDIPERRAVLLEKLLGSFEVPDLKALLPDSKKQLEELARLAKLELEKLRPLERLEKVSFDVPVMLSYMISSPEAAIVNKALDEFITRNGPMTRSKALIGIAHYYSQHRAEEVQDRQVSDRFPIESLSN